MVAWRYGISLLVFNSIPPSFAAYTREVISWKLDERKKLRMSARRCMSPKAKNTKKTPNCDSYRCNKPIQNSTLRGDAFLVRESRYLPKVYISFFFPSRHILWQDLADGPPSCSVLLDRRLQRPDSTLNDQKSERSMMPSHPPIR